MLIETIGSLAELEYERERTRSRIPRECRTPARLRAAEGYLRDLERSIRSARAEVRSGRAYRREQAARRRED